MPGQRAGRQREAGRGRQACSAVPPALPSGTPEVRWGGGRSLLSWGAFAGPGGAPAGLPPRALLASPVPTCT